MNWRKFTILSFSIIGAILVAKLTYSCIPEAIYYNYPSFFGNKAPEQVAYRPFFYVSEDPYYNNYDDQQQNNDDLLNLDNLKEWQDYTHQTCSLIDLDSLINKYPVQTLRDISTGNLNHLTVRQRQNTFSQWLFNNNKRDALQYLIFAKDCEPFVTTKNYWDTLTVNIDSSEILIKDGINKWNNTKDSFLKSRYAFQILRLAFYNKKYDRTLKLYDSLIGNASSNSRTLSDYRSLGLKAGVYFRRNNYPQAAYLYSKLFTGPDGVKQTAMLSFLWSIRHEQPKNSKTVLQSAYELCSDDHERAVMTIMQALRETDKALPLIKKAYALDPAIKGLDVIFNREINKMEERYLTYNIDQSNKIEYLSYFEYFEGQPAAMQAYLSDSVRKTYPGYLGQLNAFSQKMIKDQKSGSPAFWHLSSAYISYMLDDVEQMSREMSLAKSSGMNNEESQLFQVFEILKIIKNQDIITSETETLLLPQLKKLDMLADSNSDRNQNFYSVMNLLLAPKYLAQKDTIKALYCMAHSRRENTTSHGYSYINFFDFKSVPSKYRVDVSLTDRPGQLLDKMDIISLHKIQSYLDNSNHSPFDKWLVNNTYYNESTLKELEGTKYLRAFDFKSAAAILKNVPHLDSLSYPFEMHILDITDTIYHQDTSIITTKYSFAKEMAALQQAIASDSNNTLALYKYALGLYAMSYYGRAPHLFIYYHSTSDEYKYYKTTQRDQLPNVFQEYYGLYTAEKYFNLAAKAAKTATLKAKCIFGAAKCWQKRCADMDEKDYEDLNYFAYSLTNPYFKTLSTQYSSSEFTKALYNTCSYYRDYLKKN
ncbi:hypothetical protein SAMN05192529_10415 [Arachidicoccus rhizosphaerae]|uniref:Tetratricopeptide repeat-containing protein n=1 Tax=Arachidicoccus rhizosphaerae TaxID=551991 RepID=A0A1H3WX60_9BACT|nr:hypothetical protein [Arachidicoccus rhizosphaerae]SDZ90912.1 hypothetical protein SAMN05192529_10415 [Arachidicoccus rhizosphaerae]